MRLVSTPSAQFVGGLSAIVAVTAAAVGLFSQGVTLGEFVSATQGTTLLFGGVMLLVLVASLRPALRAAEPLPEDSLLVGLFAAPRRLLVPLAIDAGLVGMAWLLNSGSLLGILLGGGLVAVLSSAAFRVVETRTGDRFFQPADALWAGRGFYRSTPPSTPVKGDGSDEE